MMTRRLCIENEDYDYDDEGDDDNEEEESDLVNNIDVESTTQFTKAQFWYVLSLFPNLQYLDIQIVTIQSTSCSYFAIVVSLNSCRF